MNFSNKMWAFLMMLAMIGRTATEQVEDTFAEEVLFKPLPNDHIYAFFQFTTLWPDSVNASLHHTRLFPRSLGEIVSRYRVEELHLSLTEGLWRHERWGYPIADAPPGAELVVRFLPDGGEDGDVDVRWRRLAETLSGLFCASLNFVDASNSLSPRLSFGPTGVRRGGPPDNALLRYATLPREIVCTENLTPWKKLLPCDSKRGLASLLNSGRLHNTNHHSLGVHYRKVCSDRTCSSSSHELRQTVSLVYDSEAIGGRDWSVLKLFGQGLFGPCPLAATSLLYVDVTANGTDPFTLTPEPDRVRASVRGGVRAELAVYDMTKRRTGSLNVAAVRRSPRKIPPHVPAPVYANRHVAGYGQERSAIVTAIRNNHWQEVDAVLLENIPWFLPVYLQSLLVVSDGRRLTPIAKHYIPGKGKTRPYHLELALRLPPKSTTTVSIEFDFVFLKWQEYPPDANHGFYVGSAVLTAQLPLPKNFTSSVAYFDTIESSVNVSRQYYVVQVHTESMIITLPTPDFSMPYNVICLACTVVALAFGPLYNITTKSLQLRLDSSEKTKNPLRMLKNKLFGKKSEKNEQNDEDDKKVAQDAKDEEVRK